MDLNSKFHKYDGQKNVFQHQIKQMKTNDEIITINLNKNSRLRSFRDKKLKEKAQKIGRL